MSDMGSILDYSSDIADAEAPKSLPAGDYPAKITGAEVGTSQSSGKPQVVVSWLIDPDDFPADYEDTESFADGKTLKTYQGAADDKASRFRMRKFIEAIGAPAGAKVDVNDWVGREAVVTIRPEGFEGIERERIVKVEAK